MTKFQVKPEGVNFGAGPAYLVGIFSFHDDAKLASLLIMTLVFQRFPIHGRLEALVVPGLFLNILTNFILSEGDSLGFLPVLGKVVAH